MSFIAISNILGKSIKKQGLAHQIQASLICEEFDNILKEKWGEKITPHVRALYFKDNILTIASLSSVATQEIRFAEKEILEKINKKNGSDAIQKIRYLT